MRTMSITAFTSAWPDTVKENIARHGITDFAQWLILTFYD